MARPLNFQQIEAFRAVVLLGTTVAAAKTLHTTQPTISRLIGQVQRATGLQLFVNDRGRLQLTREGRHLFETVQVSFQGMARIEQAAAALRESGAGVFRIASTPALGQSVLPAAMEHFARKFPQVRLNVQTLSRREIEERLRVGLYDIALTNMPYDRAEFNVSVVHESEAVCISAPKHRFAKLRVVQLSDLVGEGLISLSNEDPVTQALREQFVKHEMSMSTSIETIYSSTMCTFAAHGLGVGIINPYMAAVFKDRLCIRAFRPRLPVTTYVAFTRFSPASELAQHFHSSIKAAYRSGW